MTDAQIERGCVGVWPQLHCEHWLSRAGFRGAASETAAPRLLAPDVAALNWVVIAATTGIAIDIESLFAAMQALCVEAAPHFVWQQAANENCARLKSNTNEMMRRTSIRNSCYSRRLIHGK